MLHRDVITKEAIWHWKALLVAMNNAFDRRSMDLLLTVNDLPFVRYSGDAVADLSGLIQAKLIEVMDFDATSTGPVVTGQFRVQTTQRGKLLIDAWKTGESEKYRAMLSLRLEDSQP